MNDSKTEIRKNVVAHWRVETVLQNRIVWEQSMGWVPKVSAFISELNERAITVEYR